MKGDFVDLTRPADVAMRQDAIVALAREHGRVTVDDLAAHFDVTPQTIRRDLNELSARQILQRVHGGAVFSTGVANLEYEKRRQIAAGEKAAIGRAAASLIPDGASLFVNIGTTTEAVSEALLSHDALMVITNNINVANRMRLHPQIRGGDRRRRGARVRRRHRR